jgi:hypothetical protein
MRALLKDVADRENLFAYVARDWLFEAFTPADVGSQQGFKIGFELTIVPASFAYENRTLFEWSGNDLVEHPLEELPTLGFAHARARPSVVMRR